jgi:eukaryotic-like serine/threonine-protein kinase
MRDARDVASHLISSIIRPFSCWLVGQSLVGSPQASSPSGNYAIDLPVRPGQVYLGKFRIEKIIGEGAMGLVVEATHLALDERVALKFLRRSALARPDIVARFAREARAAAKIKSDHVARVYDVGNTGDGQPYIVMEHLDGKDLEALIADGGPPPLSDSIEWVIQACEGLASAHAHGIVHRDIKPANLFMVERSGFRQIKLLDFGISKAGLNDGGGGTNFLEVDVGAANTTQIMGSPHYMSPEQIRSTKDVDARADVWSLGVVLYELVTGKTPFDGTEITSIIAQVLHEPHHPVRSLCSDPLPEGLEEIIDRCLSKDPETRFQTPADLAVALLPFAPKRARGVADRATAVTVRAAAGNAFASPDSLPPPRRSMVTSKAPPAIILPTPKPSESNTAVAPHVVNATAAVPASSAQQRPLTFWLAVIAIVIGLAGGLFAIIARVTTTPPQQPPPATATTTTTTAQPQPTPTPTPTPAPTPTPTPTPLAAETTEPQPTSTPKPVQPLRQWHPVTTTTPTPTTTTTPTVSTPPAPSKESDIRLER